MCIGAIEENTCMTDSDAELSIIGNSEAWLPILRSALKFISWNSLRSRLMLAATDLQAKLCALVYGC